MEVNSRPVRAALVGGTASEPMVFSGQGTCDPKVGDPVTHPVPDLSSQPLLDLPASYDGPIFVTDLKHTLRGEPVMGADAEAFNANRLMHAVADQGVPMIYLSDGKSVVRDGQFLAPFPRSLMVTGNSLLPHTRLMDRFRPNPDAMRDLLGALRDRYPNARLFVLGNNRGNDAQVAQATPNTSAYIHNVDPSQSRMPADFQGVLTDDYTPEFQARLVGDIANARARSASLGGHPQAPVTDVPASPNPPAMPRYTFVDRLRHQACFGAAMAAGLGATVRSAIERYLTDGSQTLAMLQNPATTPQVLAQASPRDLAGMADRLIYDRHIDDETRSTQLMRLITAHGTGAAAMDAVTSRIHDPERFEQRLTGPDRARYLALQQADQPERGDWDSWQTYMDEATASTVSPGTRMENFIDGEASFKAQYDAIDHARKFVNLSIHTFASDQAGWEYARHLADAADRGCKVRVLYDKFGSSTSMGQPTDPKLWAFLKAHGVELVEDGDSPLYSHISHRKVLSTDDGIEGSDGVVSFTGGVNIADYHRDYWHDVFSRVTGPGAVDLNEVFVRQWEPLGGAIPEAERQAMLAPQPSYQDGGKARVVSHDGLQDRNMKLAYLRAIKTATTSIDIADPYFTDKDVFAALEEAAKRGVKVRLFWPHDDNQKSTQYAARAQYQKLLDAGVEIYEYAGLPMAHTKIAVFDNRLCTVGSSNLDARSLVNNDEANIWMDDPNVANDLTQRYFNTDVPQSYRITAYQPGRLEALKNRVWSALDGLI